ncbi:unnamed protein product, partial [Oikopleura dioica]
VIDDDDSGVDPGFVGL